MAGVMSLSGAPGQDHRLNPGSNTVPEASFEEWVDARQGALLRSAYLLTGERQAAEDLVQTTFARMFLAWNRLKDRGSLDAYARRVLLNELRSNWRFKARHPEQLTDAPPDQAASAIEYDGEQEAVWSFLASLPPRQRAVLVLRYFEDLTEAETARHLGISLGTVKSTASRALAALRQRIESEVDQ
jgi:RNA polymerase sigma-70 factor (sigma-E family)